MTADKGTILIVDDDPNTRGVLRILLTSEGFDVRAVACGMDALLACSPIPPDVVLLDVTMPGWDGYEVRERLRKMYSPTEVVVVFLTAADIITYSTDDYCITKPYDPHRLVQLLHRILASKAVALVSSQTLTHESPYVFAG
jgi:two-component system OmpR family response regulator